MPLAIRGKVQGMDSLRNRLREFGVKFERSATRKAIKAGTRVFLASVKSALHADDTGALRMSLGDKTASYRGGKVLVGVVGPRTGTFAVGRGRAKTRKLSRLGQKLEALGKQPARYAHLLEGGTRPHAIGSGSTLARPEVVVNGRRRRKAVPHMQRGRMHPGARPRPFMAPGYHSGVGAAQAAMTRVLAEEVRTAASG